MNIATQMVIRFHCSVCFNVVRRTPAIEDGAYDRPKVLCIGAAHDHAPNEMTEVLWEAPLAGRGEEAP